MTDAGTNVRTIRQQVGMSLRAAAEAAGIDPSTWSRIENGKTQLTEDLARKMAKVLHVSVGMFFTDAGVIEMAMLRMRKAPLLTAEQLMAWRGPDGFEEAPEQIYLHTSVDIASRHVFAFEVQDESNAPDIRPGEKLLFDAKRTPKLGEIVIAQTAKGATYIGRYRVSQHEQKAVTFDIVPINRLFAEITSRKMMLILRGTLVEQRRYF